MSKLAKAISETSTGEVRAARHNLNYVEIHTDISKNPIDRHYIFDLSAKFGARGIVSDSQYSASGEILTNVRKAVIEEVFGEFRQLIHDMRIALYKQDEHQVRSILDKLEYQMFEEGL